jgi:predicted porin
MKKSLIALAALGAFASGAMAQSYVTVYGIVDLGLVKQNRADIGSALGSGIGLQNKELNVEQSTRSRLGFKGVEDLGGGYQAKFKLEHRLKPDTGAQNGSVFWDMSVVSLVTPVGEFGLGRDYAPAFYLQYQLDPWLNQGIAMIGGSSYPFAAYTNASNRATRMNNGVYYTIAANGFTAMAAVSPKDDTTNTKTRVGLAVQYAAGPLFVGLAYDQSELLAADAPALAGKSTNLIMLGAAYDFGWIKPRLSFAKADKDATSPYSYTLAATAPLGSGFVKFGASKLHLDNSPTNTKSGKASLGYEYTMSKRTALYTDVTYGKTSGTPSVTGFDAGIRHMF